MNRTGPFIIMLLEFLLLGTRETHFFEAGVALVL